MTYIVLARKWRPMIFEDVVGQAHVTRTLTNALTQNRLGHAFIFAGPRGVGKTTTARLLAKTVNCENQPAINPCNNCTSCQAVTNGQSLDVIEIDGASNRGIDEIRNLRENIRFAPAASSHKIYVIDEVHMLSKDAFNALLKTLEEPPSHAIFIFATTEIHRVPLTILSRCQRFDFRRIPTEVITNQLEKIAKEEKILAERDALLLIARKSEGSMRDATSILDQLSSSIQNKISVKEVQETLGIIGEDLYFEFTDLMQQKDDSAILKYAQNLFFRGHDVMNFINGLEEHFRNLLVTKAIGNANSVESSDVYKKQYEASATPFEENDLLHYLDILVQNEQLIKYSEHPQLILELLLLKLAHKPLAVDLETLLALLKDNPGATPLGNLPTKNPTPPSPESSPVQPKSSPTPPAGDLSGKKPQVPSSGDSQSAKDHFAPLKSPPAIRKKAAISRPAQPLPMTESSSPNKPVTAGHNQITLKMISDQWPSIIADVKKEKIALASFLQDGVPSGLTDNTLSIAFDPKTNFHMDHVQKNAVVIEKILKKRFNTLIKIHCEKRDFEKEGIQKKIHSPEEVFENIKNKEPVLKKIIELFDCENPD